MSKLIQPRTLKGFRDFSPEKMRVRKYLIGVLGHVFEQYGFQPMDTPVMEYADILEGKYGAEGEQLMYKFVDHGERRVAMRYDLTIPFARFMAMNQQIPLPFRRYHISPVWRADNPQHGRFREFWQCDVDIAGASSYLADVELLSLAYDVFSALRLQGFVIRINDRRVLNGLLHCFSFAEDEYGEVLRIVDKLDKIGVEGVAKEMAGKGFSSDHVSAFLALLTMNLSADETIVMLRDKLAENAVAMQGLEDLSKIFSLLKKKSRGPGFFSLDLSLARGLSYYDGTIFEAVVEKPKIGSVLGGGRYNGLIGMFSGKSIPAVGLSFGFERLVAVLEELELVPTSIQGTTVLVTIFSAELAHYSIEVAEELRKAGIATEIYPADGAKLGKQFEYADKLHIPIAIVAGPDEAAQNRVTVKALGTGNQEVVEIVELVKKVREMLR
ncbi:MAG: histidine--tRNA ligase [bacterium]